VSASVRGASAGRPPSSAASDLTSLLRATPSRSTQGTAQAGPVRQSDAGSTDEAPAGSSGEGEVGSGSATGTTKLTDSTSTTTPSRSAFGETLAASMSGPSTAPQGATPTRSTKTKGTDPKSLSSAGLLPALSLPAAPTETPANTAATTSASSGGATQAVSALTGGPDSSADPVEADGEPAASATSPAILATDSPDSTGATTAASQELSFAAATFASFKPAGQPVAGKTQSDEPDQPAAPESAISSSAPAASIAAPIVVAHSALAQLTTAMTQGQGSADAQYSGAASADSGAAANALGAAGAAAANSASSAAPPTPPATSTVSVPVHAEVGSAGWAQELGVRLNWMAQAGISSASLHLTPEQLGPVEVRISVHQNNASVWFGAAQADTRSALEQALPKLKEMFASQGMNLAHSGVSDQSTRGAQRDPQSQPTPSQAAALRGLNATPVTSAARVHQGLIDTYA
jgi:flagellar hook-length control protein FliK